MPQFFILLKKIVMVAKSSWLDKHHATGKPCPNSSMTNTVVRLKSQQTPLWENISNICFCSGLCSTIKKSYFIKSKPSCPCSLQYKLGVCSDCLHSSIQASTQCWSLEWCCTFRRPYMRSILAKSFFAIRWCLPKFPETLSLTSSKMFFSRHTLF